MHGRKGALTSLIVPLSPIASSKHFQQINQSSSLGPQGFAFRSRFLHGNRGLRSIREADRRERKQAPAFLLEPFLHGRIGRKEVHDLRTARRKLSLQLMFLNGPHTDLVQTVIEILPQKRVEFNERFDDLDMMLSRRRSIHDFFSFSHAEDPGTDTPN
jgi:hypothetical protein